MPKVICACPECKYNNDNNECTAAKILLGSGNIMTAWEGRKDVWTCQQYELTEEAKRMQGIFEYLTMKKRISRHNR